MECLGIVVDQRNKAHLVNYTHANGNKYTVCGKVYQTKNIVTVVELDATVHLVCRTCYETYEGMYIDDLNHDPRTAKGSLTQRKKKRYLDIQKGYATIANKFWFLSYRDWDRLNTYLRLMSRATWARKYGNGREHK